jgi:drug/metabolite transporter (DMT)-like permease
VWLAALAMGVTATACQLAMTRAYAHAPAAQVGPFIYSAVLFAAALDWLFWRKLPDAFTVVGGVLVAAAGILSLRLNPADAEAETPGPANV